MKGTSNMPGKSWGEVLTKRGTGIVMIAVLVVLGLRANLFFSPENLMVVLKQSGILCMMALSLTVVLLAGGFDMGAGALMQLVCNVAAGMILAGVNPVLTLPVGLCLGAACGLMNAFLVVVVHISSFVATLGTMFIIQGATMLYNGGLQLTIQAQTGFAFLGQGSIGPIPVIFVIVLAVCAALHFVLKHTTLGLRMYATGENPQAATLRGINTRVYMLIGYVISGALLGLTGVLQCSYNYGASAVASGMDFLIQAMAAAYLGSTFSKTGELSVIGTCISGVFVSALSNALIINNISNRQITGILGLILILSILLNVIHKREIGQVTIF